MKLFLYSTVVLALCWNRKYGSDALSPRYRRVPLPENLVPRVFSMDVAAECEVPTEADDVKATTMNANSANGESEGLDQSLPKTMLELPRHSHDGVNSILTETELLIQQMHKHSKKVDPGTVSSRRKSGATGDGLDDAIFANSYVDLGKVDTVGYVIFVYSADGNLTSCRCKSSNPI